MEPVALAAGERLQLLLLIVAPEIEARQIGSAVELLPAHHDDLLAAGDLLPGAVALPQTARLITVRDLHGLAELEEAAVRLLGADDHFEQSGFPGAVRPDDPDDSATRQIK